MNNARAASAREQGEFKGKHKSPARLRDSE